MSGDREKVTKSTSKTDDIHINNIRYHESGGKVHFHDDKASLKCTVPVADFWSAWNDFKANFNEDGKRIRFIDIENNTSVVMGWIYKHDSVTAIVTSIDIEIFIKELEISQNFKDMEDFIQGR